MQPDTHTYVMKARWSSGLAVVAGLWLIVSPFVLGFVAPEHGLGTSANLATAAYVVLGLLTAGLAVFHVSAPHRPMWPTVVLLVVGTVVFLSPMFLGITKDTGVDASAIITGSLVVAFGVGGAVYSTAKPTTSVTPLAAKGPAPAAN